MIGNMYKYEMDPTRTVGATERTYDAGRTRDGRRMDGRAVGRTDGRSETNIPPPPPPTTSLCGGYNNDNETDPDFPFAYIYILDFGFTFF